MDASARLIERTTKPSEEVPVYAQIAAVIAAEDGVDDVDKLLTRKFGDRIYVEAEISVNGDMPLSDAHAIAKRVHDSIERGIPAVKHCTVHVNPVDHAEDESSQ